MMDYIMRLLSPNTSEIVGLLKASPKHEIWIDYSTINEKHASITLFNAIVVNAHAINEIYHASQGYFIYSNSETPLRNIAEALKKCGIQIKMKVEL